MTHTTEIIEMTIISAALLVAAGICIGWWFLKQPQALYETIGKHKKPQRIMLIVLAVLFIAALVTGIVARTATTGVSP